MGGLLGGIEAGGTKFICAIGTGPADIHATCRIPTTSPETTLSQAATFFLNQSELPDAIGIGSFGPVNVDRDHPHYGHITTTPKAGWSFTDIAGQIRQALGRPVAFDTDVNAAALGEHAWGAGQGCNNLLYITVGTGIGGGAIIGGKPVHGLVHPEMGHMYVPRADNDNFAGACPFHGDCLEGLAAGPAIAQRWGAPAESLPANHPAWPLEAHYLALAVTNLVFSLSPERIILGGGILQQKQLMGLIREQVFSRLGGYVHPLRAKSTLDSFIVPPALGSRAGVLGAMRLGQLVLQRPGGAA